MGGFLFALSLQSLNSLQSYVTKLYKLAGIKGGSSHSGRRSFGTKIHAKVDAIGMPLQIILTRGEQHESQQAIPLIADEDCNYLIAGRAYDDGDFRQFLLTQGTIPVIPSKKNRLIHLPHDKHIYKERKFVERFFNRIKQFRRIATRYDKLAITFMGAVLIACIFIWLKA